MKRKGIFVGLVAVMVLALATVGHSQGSRKQKARTPRLPAAVTEAIKNDCPDCTIAKVGREKKDGIIVYDFEFRNGQGEMDVAADGTILERETQVPTSKIPAAALDAIRNAGGSILLTETDEVRAEIKDGKVVKLDTPTIRYEADLVKENQTSEVAVTPDGQVAEAPKWKTKTRQG
jgi:hypothetical protein